MSRPLSQKKHVDLPGEVFHFDNLSLGDGKDRQKYLFVLKDDFIAYTWLNAAKHDTAEHAAAVLSQWQRTFTAPHYWVSDQGRTSLMG